MSAGPGTRVVNPRQSLVTALFDLFERVCQHQRGRATVRRVAHWVEPNGATDFSAEDLTKRPYHDLSAIGAQERADRPAVFVTARFRTGSTLLWRLFRELDGVTAYYEPLNERRWFDVAKRGGGVDATHRGVVDYWEEYDGLEGLSEHYRESWIQHHLYMNEDSWDPCLARYLQALIDVSPGLPVLQFNRVDFRLRWLKHHFPAARILHLYRHPREQWVSTLHGELELPHSATLAEFAAVDRFYLTSWIRDLQWRYPVLRDLDGEHPYFAFYLLWRLSFLHARRHADASFAYESLVEEPDDVFARIAEACGLEKPETGYATARVGEASATRYAQYAPESWYLEQEYRAEAFLRAASGRGGSDG